MSHTETETNRWGGGEVPELEDVGGRWGKPVVGSTRHTTHWRGHTIEADVQLFDDGTYHVRIPAPADPPEFAADLLTDLLSRDGFDPSLAVVLASRWGIELDELEGER